MSKKIDEILNEVLIEPCEFWMGSEDDDAYAYEDEKPRHKVRLTRGYWMMPTPVTQELWEEVMGSNPSRFPSPDRPVESVSWYDSIRFCNALSKLRGLPPAYEIGEGEEPKVTGDRDSTGYRLPTEAEWECAAKAGTELKYAGSDDLDEVGWYWENSDGHIHPVARKTPNAWGLYDMSGNVWEWCWDRYGDYSSENLDPNTDPDGSDEVLSRVFRGGCFFNDAFFLRAAFRNYDYPSDRYFNVGFRFVRSEDSSKEPDIDPEEGVRSLTGRTPAGPAIQNIPIRTGEGRRIRDAFRAKENGSCTK